MNIITFILALIAVVLFLIASGGLHRVQGERVGWNLVPLGLALVTAAWIIESLWISHAQQIHF